MIRNEYRRAFIMLRAIMPGYGGHIRLERRTLTGSMYFIITAPQGVSELAAALVGQQNGEYYAAPIGPLVRDRRGQLALAWPFDPRSIEGRPLEAYPWVAVVATGGPCALALTGNVEGSRAVDVRALERAACAAFSPGESPAADLPEREAAPVIVPAAPEPESPLSQEPRPEEPEPTAASPKPVDDDGEETRGDVRIYTMKRSRLRRIADRSAGSASPSTPAAQAEPEPPAAQEAHESEPTQLSTEAMTPPSDAGSAPLLPAEPPSAQVASDAPASAPEPVTAAKQLGLDITVPWPEAAESLRRLFATQAPAVDAPRDGFTYVRVPMPAGSGFTDSLAGLSARDGQIIAIRHALLARRAPEPPAGMENYTWIPGDGEEGFWATNQNLQ